MGPAKGKQDVIAFGETRIAAIAVDLQGAVEASKMRDRPLCFAVGRINVGNPGRLGAAPRPIIRA